MKFLTLSMTHLFKLEIAVILDNFMSKRPKELTTTSNYRLMQLVQPLAREGKPDVPLCQFIWSLSVNPVYIMVKIVIIS